MPTVWSENDLITAEKLNNTGINDVLDLGVLDVDLSQDDWFTEGTLNEEQIEKLKDCKFVKFQPNISGYIYEIFIPVLLKFL